MKGSTYQTRGRFRTAGPDEAEAAGNGTQVAWAGRGGAGGPGRDGREARDGRGGRAPRGTEQHECEAASRPHGCPCHAPQQPQIREEQPPTLMDLVKEAVTAELRTALAELPSVFQAAAELELLRRKEYLNAEEVEKLYGIPAATLKTRRTRGGGPSYLQHARGSCVTYTHEDIRQYMERGRIRR